MPNIIEITDFSAPELDVYARLTQAQLRNRLEPEKGVFIAESPKVIARALDAGYQPLSLLMERKQITGPAQDILTRCGDAPVYTADREMLARLTGYELTRGVLCAFRRPAPRTVEQVCRDARRVAVLEGIVDSTNVGAIFRSAAALNMDAVLITPSCCDPLCRRAVRVSMGTVFQVPWAQIGTTPADWPEHGMAQLHALGFKTAAMALSDRSVSIDDNALAAEPKLAIVLGTEGDGLAHSTIAACDYTVKIPMSHGVDSLNVAAASAVGYVGAGTIEFLVDKDRNYFFLEMNTRLQVEHPITEEVVGIDLVKEQIFIADGQPLRYKQSDIRQRGHAIECRICAEDAEANFMPSPGQIRLLVEPSGIGIRLDSYVYEKYEIPIHYDPMIGKLIVWATNRQFAIERMCRALDEYKITGIKNNITYLHSIMQVDDFVRGDYNTSFIEKHAEELVAAHTPQDKEAEDMTLIAAFVNYMVFMEDSGASAAAPQQTVTSRWREYGKRKGVKSF